MSNLRALIISILMISIIPIGCNEDDPQIKITSISFDSVSVEVVEGTTVNLDDYLTIEGEDADQAEIVFTSDNDEVVTVSGNTLSAVGVGEAEVEATETNTNESATIEVTVIANAVAVTGITLNETIADLKVGETLQLEATVAPEDATESGVTWSVDFPDEAKHLEGDPTDIATVSDAGLVTAVSAGDVVIIATTKDGGFTASKEISVTNIAVTGVSLSETSLSVNVGETGQLTATVSPSNATNQGVIWSLVHVDEEEDTFAEINTETGVVTGKSECEACGLALVATTEDGGFTATVDLFVVYIAVTSIEITPASIFEIDVDDTQQMEVTITPSNASNQEITWEITAVDAQVCGDARTTVSVNYDDYATIDEDGLLTAHSAYNDECYRLAVQAYVEDLDDPAEAEFEIIQYVTSIEITEDGESIPTKTIELEFCTESFPLGVTVLPTDASDNSVTWSSSDENAISVNSSGELTIENYDSNEVRITVTANDGSGISDYVDIIDPGCD